MPLFCSCLAKVFFSTRLKILVSQFPNFYLPDEKIQLENDFFCFLKKKFSETYKSVKNLQQVDIVSRLWMWVERTEKERKKIKISNQKLKIGFFLTVSIVLIKVLRNQVVAYTLMLILMKIFCEVKNVLLRQCFSTGGLRQSGVLLKYFFLCLA